MHLRGNVIYKTWENFWKKAYKSSYFRAQYDETSERTDWSLSERQLFTQSNGRTLLGQDTMGRLHFLCTPHDKIYAVPSGGTDLGGQFKGYIGQYYQNDTALLLGKMKYDLELDNGLMISGANKQTWTTYYDDFLPRKEIPLAYSSNRFSGKRSFLPFAWRYDRDYYFTGYFYRSALCFGLRALSGHRQSTEIP